jgi:hypothetical protein
MDVNNFKNWTKREKALDQLDHKALVLLSIDWAYSVLPIYEAEYPEENSPRKAIEAAEQWVSNTDINSLAIAMNATSAARAAHDAAASREFAYAAPNAAYTAANAAYTAAYTAYATRTAYAASAYAASAAYTASWAARTTKWEWLYKTYLKAVGPENKTFNNNWLTPTVKSLLYDTSLSPIIADALEDAGCDNNDILQHLRNNKEWIRADWVLRRLNYGH